VFSDCQDNRCVVSRVHNPNSCRLGDKVHNVMLQSTCKNECMHQLKCILAERTTLPCSRLQPHRISMSENLVKMSEIHCLRGGNHLLKQETRKKQTHQLILQHNTKCQAKLLKSWRSLQVCSPIVQASPLKMRIPVPPLTQLSTL